jgi:hypothetical protein
VTVAVRVPAAVGLKVISIVHLAPAATLDPQLLVWAKSLALVPESAMLVTPKVALPELVRVIVCAPLAAPTAWLMKVRLEGETPATEAVPVPESATVCGLLTASLAKVMAAVRVPFAVGVKVTLIVHLAPAATLDPQLFVWAKSLALAPETAMFVMLKAALPELVRVTARVVLVESTD